MTLNSGPSWTHWPDGAQSFDCASFSHGDLMLFAFQGKSQNWNIFGLYHNLPNKVVHDFSDATLWHIMRLYFFFFVSSNKDKQGQQLSCKSNLDKDEKISVRHWGNIYPAVKSIPMRESGMRGTTVPKVYSWHVPLPHLRVTWYSL